MNLNRNFIKLSKVLPKILRSVQKDVDLYNIAINSKHHKRLLFHHTLKHIFEIKKNDPKSYIIVDTFNLVYSTTIHEDYIKFLEQLQKIIPNITVPETHLDLISNKILTNMIQKSTEKNKNLYRLRRLSRRHGLSNIIDIYLQDPSFQYIICT